MVNLSVIREQHGVRWDKPGYIVRGRGGTFGKLYGVAHAKGSLTSEFGSYSYRDKSQNPVNPEHFGVKEIYKVDEEGSRIIFDHMSSAMLEWSRGRLTDDELKDMIEW